jgi:7-keto-8-aminopelargonate synthetase-like enzyme
MFVVSPILIAIP